MSANMRCDACSNLTFPFNLEPAGVVASAHQAVKIVEPGKTIVYAWSVPDQVRCCANLAANGSERTLAAHVVHAVLASH